MLSGLPTTPFHSSCPLVSSHQLSNKDLPVVEQNKGAFYHRK